MSREFGKLYMTMWADRDFTSLTPGAQRLYVFLLSQPDLSRAGTVTMALRRWSRSAAGMSPESVVSDLEELARGGFVVVDEYEEEVLVRSYIRNDEGWKSPNIMKSIRSAAQNVLSETLRAVIRDELGRIDTTRLPTVMNERTKRTTREVVEYLIAEAVEALASCKKDPAVTAWGRGNPSVGGQETLSQSEKEGFPEGFPEGSLTTTATSTATSTATTTSTAPNPDPEPEPEPDGFSEFYAAYPRKEQRRAAALTYKKARKRASESEILEGAQRFANDPNLPERRYIPHPSKWLNADGWKDEPLPERNVRTPNNPDPMDKWRTAFNSLAADEYPDHHMIEGAS